MSSNCFTDTSSGLWSLAKFNRSLRNGWNLAYLVPQKPPKWGFEFCENGLPQKPPKIQSLWIKFVNCVQNIERKLDCCDFIEISSIFTPHLLRGVEIVTQLAADQVSRIVSNAELGNWNPVFAFFAKLTAKPLWSTFSSTLQPKVLPMYSAYSCAADDRVKFQLKQEIARLVLEDFLVAGNYWRNQQIFSKISNGNFQELQMCLLYSLFPNVLLSRPTLTYWGSFCGPLL